MNAAPGALPTPRDTSWISIVLIFMILFVGAGSVVGAYQVKRKRAKAERRDRARLAAEREFHLLRAEALALQPQGPGSPPPGSSLSLALSFLTLGETALSEGDVEKAKRCFHQSAQEDEAVYPLHLIGFAKIEMRAGDFDTALTYLAHVLDRVPNHPEALLLKARTNLGRGDPEAAVKDVESPPASPERDALLQDARQKAKKE